MGTAEFYEHLADLYDVIYADWDAARARQNRALHRGFQLAGLEPPLRVLDAASGIGTQTIPLLHDGHDVVARDLSGRAIQRLKRDAAEAGLEVDAAACSMTTVSRSVRGAFDAVIAMDNAIPHILSDDEIGLAFAEFRHVLEPSGALFVSVRDYTPADRNVTRLEYGERMRGDRRFRLHQDWVWTGPDHYDTELVIEESRNGGWTERVRTRSSYYAIPLARLVGLMELAGFGVERVDAEVDYFQPLLLGRLA